MVDWSGRTGHVDCSLTDFVVSAFLEEAAAIPRLTAIGSVFSLGLLSVMNN